MHRSEAQVELAHDVVDEAGVARGGVERAEVDQRALARRGAHGTDRDHVLLAEVAALVQRHVTEANATPVRDNPFDDGKVQVSREAMDARSGAV